MSIYSVGGADLKEMICVASAYLTKNKKAVDALNVFPVPDGDTGVNMSLTLQMAAREAMACTSSQICDVANAISKGSLKGARGNSGVILSQIFRGFSKNLAEVTDEMDGVILAQAMRGSVDAAYRAVMKPKEGTVLTVVRAMADAAEEASKKDSGILAVLNAMLTEGEKTLQKTPDLLPVLKEAGVVDAGGMGLLIIFQGFKMSIEGVEIPEDEMQIITPAATISEDVESDIEFGYCTEFFIKNSKDQISDEDAERLRTVLGKIGDCVLVVGDSTLLKVHVHTNAPGKALQYGLAYGSLSAIKIDNMREQSSGFTPTPSWENAPAPAPAKPEKPMGMVAVSVGKGFEQLFGEIGVDEIVSGGQSMNPSIEDLLNAIDRVPSQNVLIFPNNKNIILAAEQAQQVSEKNVHVIATRSIPQGISAVLAFNPEQSFEENIAAMETVMMQVDSGQITRAVRDSALNGLDVHEGDYIGIFNGDMVVDGNDLTQVALDLMGKIVNEDHEVISVFYGEEVKEDEANALGDIIQERFEDCEVQVYLGGQPVYDYIFSIE